MLFQPPRVLLSRIDEPRVCCGRAHAQEHETYNHDPTWPQHSATTAHTDTNGHMINEGWLVSWSTCYANSDCQPNQPAPREENKHKYSLRTKTPSCCSTCCTLHRRSKMPPQYATAHCSSLPHIAASGNTALTAAMPTQYTAHSGLATALTVCCSFCSQPLSNNTSTQTLPKSAAAHSTQQQVCSRRDCLLQPQPLQHTAHISVCLGQHTATASLLSATNCQQHTPHSVLWGRCVRHLKWFRLTCCCGCSSRRRLPLCRPVLLRLLLACLRCSLSCCLA